MKHYSLPARVASFIFLGCSLLMCTKKDQLATLENEPGDLEKKFFTTNRTQHGDEKVLVDYLIRQHQKNKFVEKTVAQIGYPRWDKMIAIKTKSNGSGKGASDSTVTTYYIPFVRDSQQYVNASMIINTTASDTSFGYRCDWEYAQRQNNPTSISDSAEYHAIFFMVLDKAVFGYTEFDITDTSIFKHNSLTPLRIRLTNPIPGNRGNDYTTVQVCQEVIVTWQDCPYPRGQCGGPNGTCDNCPQCTDSGPWTYCWTTFVAGGSGSGSTGGPGAGSSVGGGGNNGGGTPPPCPGTTTSQRGQTVTPGCDPGWNGIGTPDPSTTFTINDITFTTSNYPGKNNGLPWRWWENASILAPFGGLPYGTWAINYLSLNPHLPFSAFQNYFMTKSEGKDDSYNQTYWDDPNLFFPQQSLPTFNSFKNAFPKRTDPLFNTARKLYSSIGGELLAMYDRDTALFQNTCALRISKALNYSGVTIPAGIDRFQGADGKYYFINCKALLIWMKKTFGVPSGTNYLVESQGGAQGLFFPYYLEFKKGIYIMTPNNPNGCPTSTAPQTGFCASGHADLIENGQCDGGCHFNATGGVKEIFIWELR